MKTPLHLNLLKEEEHFSSSPVRLRVMMPTAAVFVALCSIAWFFLLAGKVHTQAHLNEKLKQAVASITPVYAAVLDSRAQEQEYRAMARQLGIYTNSRVLFGESLSLISARVPSCIQFTEMRIPQPTLADPAHPSAAPTNRFEQVFLRISGRTSGDHPSEAVNTLLAELRTPVFTNLLRSVSIPKGAFRQDNARSASNRDTLLFEITCECQPRRFE